MNPLQYLPVLSPLSKNLFSGLSCAEQVLDGPYAAALEYAQKPLKKLCRDKGYRIVDKTFVGLPARGAYRPVRLWPDLRASAAMFVIERRYKFQDTGYK